MEFIPITSSDIDLASGLSNGWNVLTETQRLQLAQWSIPFNTQHYYLGLNSLRMLGSQLQWRVITPRLNDHFSSFFHSSCKADRTLYKIGAITNAFADICRNYESAINLLRQWIPTMNSDWIPTIRKHCECQTLMQDCIVHMHSHWRCWMLKLAE
jgi:hypothetical protein